MAPTVSVMPSELRGPGPSPQAPTTGGTAKKRKAPVGVIVAAVLVILALAAGLGVVLTSGGDDDPAAESSDTGDATDGTVAGADETDPLGAVGCPTDQERFACVLGATALADGTVEVELETNFSPGDLDTVGEFHYHVYLNPPGIAGSDAGSAAWHADNTSSPIIVDTPVSVADAQADDSTEICMTVANSGEHTAVAGTGNCIPFSA